MANDRYQIARRDSKSGKWSLAAHGATYSRAEAQDTCDSIARHSGDKTRLLKCGKESM